MHFRLNKDIKFKNQRGKSEHAAEIYEHLFVHTLYRLIARLTSGDKSLFAYSVKVKND